jgi:hypothetical protein
MRYVVLLLLCAAGCASTSSPVPSQEEGGPAVQRLREKDGFAPTPVGKKLIEYGWDAPGPDDVKAHVRDMEKRPFDGIVIRPTEPPQPGKRAGSIGRRAFSKKPFEPAEYQHNIDTLKSVKFEKFTDNFIQLVSGDLDFYDDWDACLHNVGVLAMIAKQTGCVGLMFDPEQYGPNRLWTYDEKPAALRSAHTKAEYHAKAILRGRQFMQAINKEFPNIQILCLFGPSFSYSYERGGQTKYNLIAPFIEGMCLAADEGTRITDGYEQSYMYRFRTSFEVGRREILAGRNAFDDQKAFDRVMRVGFGLWTDNDSGKHPWSTTDFDANFFQPNTYQSAIYNALSHCDNYVWVYCERLSWLSGENLPPAYEEAQRQGRHSPANIPVEHRQPNPSRARWVVDAASRQDPKLFDDLQKDHTVLTDLTTAHWTFRPDPDEKGIAEKWFASNVNAADWTDIHVSRFWEADGWDYDGYGWYRTTFSVPSIPQQKKLTLAVGAADESADVWLNGDKLGSYNIGELGWDKRFTLDTTGKLRSGDNQLTIRVCDRSGPGGLWRPIKIFVAK